MELGFREQIRRNRRRLVLILLALFALAWITGRVAGAAFERQVDPESWYGVREGPPPPWYASYPDQVAAALVLLVFVQYLRMRRRGDHVLLGLADARPLQERRLANTAAEMALAAGIGAPRLYVAEDSSLNAFACGAGRRACIVVTRGLLERLDRDALQGVIAHETAHIRNGDTKLMTLLLGMAQVFRLTAAFALGPLGALVRGMRKGGGGSRPEFPGGAVAEKVRAVAPKGPWLLLVAPLAGVLIVPVSLAITVGLLFASVVLLRYLPWIALALAAWELWRLAGDRPYRRPKKPRNLGALLWIAPVGLVVGPAILLLGCVLPVAMLLLRLAVSRNQEYLADATAVELTRQPDGLLRALRALRDDRTPPTTLSPALTPLAIAPLQRAANLLSTHPLLEDRIARLELMAGVPAEATVLS